MPSQQATAGLSGATAGRPGSAWTVVLYTLSTQTEAVVGGDFLRVGTD